MTEINYPDIGVEPTLQEAQTGSSIGEVNRDLLAPTNSRLGLLDIYEAATRSNPTLKRVRVVPIDPSDKSRIGCAKNGFQDGDGVHSVFINMSPAGLELARHHLVDDKFPVQLIAEMVGSELEDFTPENLIRFMFAHELGHTLFYEQFTDNPSEYKKLTDFEFSKLPIPNVRASWLTTDEGRKWVAENWQAIQHNLGVSTFDELVSRQARAYRQMRQERFADDFAIKLLGKQKGKREVTRNKLAKLLRR